MSHGTLGTATTLELDADGVSRWTLDTARTPGTATALELATALQLDADVAPLELASALAFLSAWQC